MTTNNRKPYQTETILAQDVILNNDTWQTGINNNVLVIGPTGSGKTRNFVKPNIMQTSSSMIISDPKGALYGECAAFLRSEGYTVHLIDFINMKGTVGYNPLDYIRYDEERDCYSEQDIIKVSEIIIDAANQKEPFWDMAARLYLQSLIAYVLETTPTEEHTLSRVSRLLYDCGGTSFDKLMTQYSELCPDSLSVKRYHMMKSMGTADKMICSIIGVAATNLSCFDFNALDELFNHPRKLDFAELGRQKTALFLCVSDTDRSLDRLANLFWTQALQTLCASADHDYPARRLDVPVMLYLDDFATNVYIPDFDKISSNIRSREIYVSVILQSMSQLNALYGESKAETIIGNCDRQLVLGIQDINTAAYYSQRANVPVSDILNMPLDKCLVFLRGRPAIATKKFDITKHKAYNKLLRSLRKKKSEPECEN